MEIPATVDRLPVLFRQRDYGFYPAFIYVLTEMCVELPMGLVDSGLWTVITYWLVGMNPSAGQCVGLALVPACFHTPCLRFFLCWLTLYLMYQVCVYVFISVCAYPPCHSLHLHCTGVWQRCAAT